MAIKNHKELSFVNLSGCILGSRGGDGGPDSGGPDSAVLERVLDGCKTLKSLIINNNLINEGRDFDAVKGFLTNNTTITVLSLEDVGLETTHVKKLCQALKKNTSLRHLSLGSNALSVPSFLPSRGFNDNLTHLDWVQTIFEHREHWLWRSFCLKIIPWSNSVSHAIKFHPRCSGARQGFTAEFNSRASGSQFQLIQ